MHYYIDGYNLLFHLKSAHDDLEKERDWLVQYLHHRIDTLKLNVSLVFDSHYQFGDSTRGHLVNLEIIFTSERETADDFIIDLLRGRPGIKNVTVVTSDRKLAWHARSLGAKTQSVSEFLAWLEKSYKNKLRQKQKPVFPISQRKVATGPVTEETQPVLVDPIIRTPSFNVGIEECKNYYEQVFEIEFKELLEEEKAHRKSIPPKKKNSHQTKKPSLTPPVKDQRTQTEKWLQAFEERLKEQ